MNPPVPQQFVPNHIALVMDGNGRWAEQRGLKRTEGHKRGEAVLMECVDACLEMGVKHLSAYAFSTENWRRSVDEVRFLMGLSLIHISEPTRLSLVSRMPSSA